MRKHWWQRETVLAGLLTGLAFTLIAYLGASLMAWPPERRLKVAALAFAFGLLFEWLQLGARRSAMAAGLLVLTALIFYLAPAEPLVERVDWVAPVRGASEVVVENAPEDRRSVGAPTPGPGQPGGGGRTGGGVSVAPAPGSSTGRSRPADGGRADAPSAEDGSSGTGLFLEVTNPADFTVVVRYSSNGGLAQRLGRIGAGGTRRFRVSPEAGGTTITLIVARARLVGSGPPVGQSVGLPERGSVQVSLPIPQ